MMICSSFQTTIGSRQPAATATPFRRTGGVLTVQPAKLDYQLFDFGTLQFMRFRRLGWLGVVRLARLRLEPARRSRRAGLLAVDYHPRRVNEPIAVRTGESLCGYIF